MNVAARSPIWGDVDLEAFCRVTGYSREHATRELSNIRRENSTVAFETKQRWKKGNPRKQWGVIVAERKKLRFDGYSLFYDARGHRLHNRTKLGRDGEKIAPTVTPAAPIRKPRGRPPRQANVQVSAETPLHGSSPFPNPSESKRSESNALKNPRLCDNAYKGEDSYGIQPSELYGARRDVTQPGKEKDRISPCKRSPRLRRKAFAVMERLESCHWDNCKVRFSSRAAHSYALQALADGHEESRILSCYEEALFVCHGHAVDRAASSGDPVLFNASSTIVKAAGLLTQDGLDCRERIPRWYSMHPTMPPCFDPNEIAVVRARIAATFPRGD